MYRFFYLFLIFFYFSFLPSRAAAQPADNILVTPLPDSANSPEIIIQLSEVMSCPHPNDSEWIEIYHNSASSWEMSGWKLKNAKNISRNLKTQTIQPHSFVVLDFSSGLLNNDGDTLSLENSAGDTLFTVTIPACQSKGSSFIFDGTTWLETATPTLAAPNSFPVASASASVTAGDNYATALSHSAASPSPSSPPPTSSSSSSSPAPTPAIPASFRYSALNLSAISNTSSPTASSSSASSFLASPSALPTSPSPPPSSSVIIIGSLLTLLGGSGAAYCFYVKKTHLFPDKKPVSAWEEHSDSLDVL